MMRLLNTPKRLMLPQVLLLTLPLQACGQDRPALVLPPIERAEAVPQPIVPDGEATCPHATGTPQPCLSDRQIGTLIADLAHALDQANAKLLWLHDWIVTAAKGSP